jgi:hypothetical protein
VDVVDTVAVRLHAYVQNPTSAPLVIKGMDAKAFMLTDAMGKSLTSVGRLRAAGKTPRDSITVAPGKRVELTLLFATNGAGDNAALTLSPVLSAGGSVTGIPLRTGDMATGGLAPAPNAP